MASSNSLVTILLVGVGGYLIYEWFIAPSTAAATATPTTPPVTPSLPPPAPGTPPAPAQPAFNSLDQIYARIQAAVGTNTTQTPDQFNYFLNQQLPAGKTAPDPTAVFTQAGFDRTQPMTIANWWGAVAPWLQTNYGLSGLGMFGGLGSLARSARRRG